jgi:hypothetical protein
MREFAPHTILQKKKEKKCGKGGENACDRDRERKPGGALELWGVLNKGEGE